MKRLRGFDYKRPFFYMVTLKRRPELAAFSQISDEAPPPGWRRMGPAPQNAHGRPRYLVENEITKAFARVIREFAAKWWGLWPIDCFVIMPDHIHLLIRIKDTGDQMPLGSYVYQLMKALAGEYWRLTGQAPQNEVQRTGAGTAKRLEQGKSVAGAASSAPPDGNLAILDLPVLVAVKGHRATKPGTAEWNALVDSCARIGPGGAGVGTFMSPLEKECGNAIAKAGGKWVVLSPEGFHERWHPPREKERFCAEGRMLFLSLWPPMERRPQNAELYQRCHEMGDVVAEGLR